MGKCESKNQERGTGAIKQGRKESHGRDALSNWSLPKAFVA